VVRTPPRRHRTSGTRTTDPDEERDMSDIQAHDTDGNGWVDTWTVDVDHDGDVDALAHDTDENGWVDLYEEDTDGDGHLDTTVVDWNEDGVADEVHVFA
jgi:hypothetical protein